MSESKSGNFYVCAECVSDRELKRFIDSKEKKGTCDFTKQENVPVITVKELADYIKQNLDMFFESAKYTMMDLAGISNESQKRISAEEEALRNIKENIKERGYIPLSDLPDKIGTKPFLQCFILNEDLLKYICQRICCSDCSDCLGCLDSLDKLNILASLDSLCCPCLKKKKFTYKEDKEEYDDIWKLYEKIISDEDEELLLKKISDKKEQSNDEGNDKADKGHLIFNFNLESFADYLYDILFKEYKLEKLLKEGNSVFRGRRMEKNQKLTPESLGSPKEEYAVSQRMSPKGTSYFYAAKDIKTVVLEVNDTSEADKTLVIGEWAIKKDLLLVNIPPFYIDDKKITEKMALFHENSNKYYYNYLFINKCCFYLVKDDTDDYKPTQILVKIIRIIHPNAKGVSYTSVKNYLTNYCLFYNNCDCIKEDVLKLINKYRYVKQSEQDTDNKNGQNNILVNLTINQGGNQGVNQEINQGV